MRIRITPARLVAAVVLVGAVLLGPIVVLVGRLDPAYARGILVGYIVLWGIATLVCITVAAVAQASVRKRHGVFSHLKQSTTAEVMDDDRRPER